MTGASGFLGAAVCRTLVESGLEVRGLTRNRGAALEPGVARFLTDDLTDDRSLLAATDGMDAVIHLAARVHAGPASGPSDLAMHWQANVEGTRAVLNAAQRAGVRRVLFASSIKVMGAYRGRPWTEADPPAPNDPYARSKLAAEALLADAANLHGIEVASVRLPLIYGPGVKANMLQLFAAVERGVPLPLKGVQNRRSVMYALNAAEAFASLLTVPHLRSEVFFASDGDAVSSEGLVRMIGRGVNRRPRLFSVPAALLRAAARLGDAVSSLGSIPFNTAVYERLVGSLECSSEKLVAVTGRRPRWSTWEGIEATAAWYLKQGRHQIAP